MAEILLVTHWFPSNSQQFPDGKITKIVHATLPIDTGSFTVDEVQKVLKKIMTNGKTPGLDEIPAEVWKTGRFNNILLEICHEQSLSGTTFPIQRYKQIASTASNTNFYWTKSIKPRTYLANMLIYEPCQ